MSRAKKRVSDRLALLLLAALAGGVLVGLLLGPRAAILGDLGMLAVRLLKALATPLIFFAIVDAFIETPIPKRMGLKLVGITLTNACVAATLALGLSHALPASNFIDLSVARRAMEAGATPGAPPNVPTVPTGVRLSAQALLDSVLPQSFVEPFVKNEVLGIVMLALLLGIALRGLRSAGQGATIEPIERLVRAGLALLTYLLHGVIQLIPLAAFGVIARAVGGAGVGVLASMGYFVALVTLGLLIHALIYYPALLWIFRGVRPWTFFKEASSALLFAFSSGSSLATLPLTLSTLQDRMGVSRDSARLAACVGTNLNNDGIVLYEAVAALFVAQVVGITLAMAGKVSILGLSVAAALGIAGIPEAGLITLALVLEAAGLPMAAVGFLFPVDWFLGRLRATVNVTSDMVVARLLDKA